jgi:ABC-2 type transport system permease protein
MLGSGQAKPAIVWPHWAAVSLKNETVTISTAKASDPSVAKELFEALLRVKAQVVSVATEMAGCTATGDPGKEAAVNPHEIEPQPTGSHYSLLSALRKHCMTFRLAHEVPRAFALVRLSVLEALSYRFALFVSAAGICGALAVIMLGLKTSVNFGIEYSRASPSSHFNYLLFLLTGIVASDAALTFMSAIPNAMRKLQFQGLLQPVLATGTNVLTLSFSVAIQKLAALAARAALYSALAALLGFSTGLGACAAATLTAIMFLPLFFGIGLASAGIILVYKVGDPITACYGVLSIATGGVLFPVGALPSWLRWTSAVVPLKELVDLMRYSVQHGLTAELVHRTVRFLPLSISCIAIGMLFFLVCFSVAQRDGTIGQY